MLRKILNTIRLKHDIAISCYTRTIDLILVVRYNSINASSINMSGKKVKLLPSKMSWYLFQFFYSLENWASVTYRDEKKLKRSGKLKSLFVELICNCNYLDELDSLTWAKEITKNYRTLKTPTNETPRSSTEGLTSFNYWREFSLVKISYIINHECANPRNGFV